MSGLQDGLFQLISESYGSAIDRWVDREWMAFWIWPPDVQEMVKKGECF